jgi:hypothetical protein
MAFVANVGSFDAGIDLLRRVRPVQLAWTSYLRHCWTHG